MQDKIQEIMKAVDYYIGATINGTYAQEMAERESIESKLRELVREPLSDEQIIKAAKSAYQSGHLSWAGFNPDGRGVYCIPTLAKCHFDLARAIERAHNITNTSGEER